MEPTLSVDSGDTVTLDLETAGAGQIQEGDSYADTTFDFATIYRLLGPIHVADAVRATRGASTSSRSGRATGGWCGT
jgi:acetamidase/formamidase